MLLVSLILAMLSLPVPQSQPVEREKQTPPIFFRWDNPHYDATYGRNRAAADSLVQLLKRIGPDSIEYVEFTAFASPEGVYERNQQLSRLRTAEVRWLIRKNYPEFSSKLRIRPGGEGWTLLRPRIAADKRMTAKSKNRILSILDNTGTSDETRKWRLSHRLGSDPKVGDLWQYILRVHYPHARSCVVTVRFFAEPGSALASVGTAVERTDSQNYIPAEKDEAKDNTSVAPDVPAGNEVAGVMPNDETAESEGSEGEGAGEGEGEGNGEGSGEAEGEGESESNGEGEGEAKDEETKSAERRERIPVLGLSTNLPYDITYIPGYGVTSIPSISLEYYPANGHWTLGADVEWPNWRHPDTHRYLQIHNITAWTRYYFKPENHRYNGWYLGGSANAAQFGVGWNEKGWEGEGLGLSLLGGHKWTFGCIYIDAGLSLGAFYSRLDSYTWGNDATGWYYYDYLGDPEKFEPRSKRWLWLGPTRLQLSIGLDLFNRNRKKDK